jgi:predicted enzyme related to lactoylglutathione lyase
MPQPIARQTKFEGAEPILRVADMSASLAYYLGVLGFENADWGNEWFTRVKRDQAGIYLSRGDQGHPGTWVWIGVEDVAALHREYEASGARIRQAPRNFPWAYEMKVEDPDGHVLRFGSDPRENVPFDSWEAGSDQKS